MRHSPFFLPSRMEDGASRSPLPSRFLPDRKRKRFLAFARNDDAGRRHSPSFLRKGTPRRRCARNGSPIPTAFSLLPLEGGAPKGRRLDGDSGISETNPSPRGKAKRRRLRRKKGSQPRLAALGSPFQGKGLAWTLPPSSERRRPEGAEVGSQRNEKKWEELFPRFALPNAAEG